MNNSESKMIENLRGKGVILQDGEKIFTGFYDIRKLSGPNIHKDYSGTFNVSGINDKLLLTKVCSNPLPELILVLKDGIEFNICLINPKFDFPNGAAIYNIMLLPGK
jgi:hypothetical protein